MRLLTRIAIGMWTVAAATPVYSADVPMTELRNPPVAEIAYDKLQLASSAAVGNGVLAA